mmetsp:Transcript_63308/g.185067  ORF Transcript_63308/g.185067 Transcript_63308/m.185067 type:complete len:286 (+) Transcript_63308:2216-3073(+)
MPAEAPALPVNARRKGVGGGPPCDSQSLANHGHIRAAQQQDGLLAFEMQLWRRSCRHLRRSHLCPVLSSVQGKPAVERPDAASSLVHVQSGHTPRQDDPLGRSRTNCQASVAPCAKRGFTAHANESAPEVLRDPDVRQMPLGPVASHNVNECRKTTALVGPGSRCREGPAANPLAKDKVAPVPAASVVGRDKLPAASLIVAAPHVVHWPRVLRKPSQDQQRGRECGASRPQAERPIAFPADPRRARAAHLVEWPPPQLFPKQHSRGCHPAPTTRCVGSSAILRWT